MKKIFATMLAGVMVIGLAGCKNSASNGGSDAAYKLGMGVTTSIGSSSAGNAQVDATVATVVTDADGKIVSCIIDVAQNKMAITDGEVPADAASMTFKTKKEKKEEYNMRGASPIGKEWYEQSEGFCAYLVGKDASEIAAIPTDGSDADLAASCTVGIDSMLNAAIKAAQ